MTRFEPINPPLRDGQLVCCSRCGRMVGERDGVPADMDGVAGDFWCGLCREHAADIAKRLA